MKKYVTYGTSGFYPGVNPINVDQILFHEKVKDPERLAIMQGRDIGKGMQAYEQSFQPGNIPPAMMSPNPSVYVGPQSIKKMPAPATLSLPITTQTQPSYGHMMGPLYGAHTAPNPTNIMPANQMQNPMRPGKYKKKEEEPGYEDRGVAGPIGSAIPGSVTKGGAGKDIVKSVVTKAVTPGGETTGGFMSNATGFMDFFNPMNYINPMVEGVKTIGTGLTGGGIGAIGSGLGMMLPPLMFGGILGKALGLFSRGTHNVRPAQDENVRMGLSGPLSPQGYAIGGMVEEPGRQMQHHYLPSLRGDSLKDIIAHEEFKKNPPYIPMSPLGPQDFGGGQPTTMSKAERETEKHKLNQFLTAAEGMEKIRGMQLKVGDAVGGPLSVA